MHKALLLAVSFLLLAASCGSDGPPEAPGTSGSAAADQSADDTDNDADGDGGSGSEGDNGDDSDDGDDGDSNGTDSGSGTDGDNGDDGDDSDSNGTDSGSGTDGDNGDDGDDSDSGDSDSGTDGDNGEGTGDDSDSGDTDSGSDGTEGSNGDGTDSGSGTSGTDSTGTDTDSGSGTSGTDGTGTDTDSGSGTDGTDSNGTSTDSGGTSGGTSTGGTTGDGDVIDLGSDDVVLTAGLARFGDCDTLLGYLRAEYSARVGPWGFDGDGWVGPVPVARGAVATGAADIAAAIPEAGASSPPVEGTDFSGTNVQETGVDEADIIKTDGRRIFTVASGRLVVVDAASRALAGSVDVVKGWGQELFVNGDSLLLISRAYSDAPDAAETVLQRINVGGPAPQVVETISVQGQFTSARSVGDTARVVLRFDPHLNFPFVYPQSRSAESVAEESNRAAVLNSTLDDWLPHYAVGTADSSTGPLLTSCTDVHAPPVFSGFGVTTVLSVPVGGGFDPSKSTAVMAPGDTVYASPGSLYAATTRWIGPDEFEGNQDGLRRAWHQRRTSIHRFDISGPQASYESSGEVLGVIHNQFSLSEHKGHLRVVTTTGDPWGEESESQVRVLSTVGDVMAEVGSVGDIGRGERVQSVRFVGDIGYVVTFRQIDPFYTIDLSNPASPAILGELKIPGFSSYLHPIGDSLVLGVGSDADESGRVTGSKVSLFDVSDLAAPREVAVWTAPDGWNDVGWEHRAFLWWPPEGLAVVPVTVWGGWSGAVVLRVADGSVTEVGRIDHEIEDDKPGRTDCRKLTESDLPSADQSSFSTELEHLIADDDKSTLLACEPGAESMTGFDCNVYPHLAAEAERLGLLRSGESVAVCWPRHNTHRILRSIVIGGDLWTLGTNGFGHFFDGEAKTRLHVNDLATLKRLAALVL